MTERSGADGHSRRLEQSGVPSAGLVLRLQAPQVQEALQALEAALLVLQVLQELQALEALQVLEHF